MHSALGTGHVVAGRYRLLEQLGRGAMGIVWRGRDTLLDREVAIKQIVLSPLVSETQARASYDRTLREARTAARLSHPGVVTVFDVVEEDGCPWIVMELVRARPLDQVIAEDGPLPPARAAQLGLGLLDALSAAHKAGVLHRDVKPSNVLISPNGKAVLTDFGIATIQGDPGLTQAGMVVGTPGFSPPERVRGDAATPASDLWSLGATLYAAVEGRGPFDRAGGSAAIVASIATEPAPRAPSAGPLAPAIEALLKSNAADRPDAATTAKMLTQAWKAARTASRVGLPGSAAAGLAGKGVAARGRAKPDSEATTATQAMSVPADTDLLRVASERDPAAAAAAAPSVAMASAAVAVSTAADAVGVVPDLMATPNFADLKMPGSTTQADVPVVADNLGLADPADAAATATDSPPGSPPGEAGGAAAGDDENGKLGELVRSHRGLVALVPVVVLAIIVGILYATLPPNNPIERALGGGSGQNQANANVGSNSRGGSHHRGHTVGRHAGSGSGQPGSPGPGKPSASGKANPSGKPSAKPSGKHSSSGNPSSSPSHSPSTSPSPSPSPSPSTSSPGTGGGPPVGYVWDTVTAASVGTIAGFRIAAPASWYMNPAVNSVFYPATGPMRMVVNLGTWTYAVAVKQARYLQSVAIAHSRYPRYHLITIGATTFRGWQAARWTFWYQGLTALHPTEVSELFFTAETYEGPQQYIMWVSAPLPKISSALKIFHVATKTLKVLPYT